jgi:WD40 repeat protein/tRNA A-37 threonylcarbamoyl transferase component Bud32
MASREVPEAPPDRASPAASQFAVTAPATPEGPARAVTAPVAPLPAVDRAVYEILGEHSRGGLGRILRARDTRTGRVVAIKEMLRADDDAVAARFAREAMLTANLQHPAIVPVYEVGRWPDGQPFYAMKLVAGRSLADAIRDAPSRRDRLSLLSHVTAVAGALAYAHDLGVVHRDLKPANVLVGRFGETVVVDWGLAKDVAEAEGQAEPVAAAASGSLTVAGALLGTPAYMPPEQARGETVDERADVYALGAMLYHVLAGAMPYAASSSGDEILEQVRAGPPRPLREIDPELPADLVAIADKAMAHDPAGRYATAGALAVDLDRFATGQLVGAHVYSPGQLLRRWARRHRAALAVAAAAAVTLAAVGVYSLQQVRGERDEARAQRRVAETALTAAEAANRGASRSLAALRRELGRQELDAGDPMRALAHLDEAARRSGRIDAGLAYMIGRAADSLAPRRWSARSDTRALERMAVSADGAVAFTAGSDGVVERWDLATGRHLGKLEAEGVVSATLSPDGRIAAVASASQLVLWDGQSIQRIPVRASAVAFSSADGRLAVGDSTGAVEIRRASEPEPLRRWSAHRGGVTSVAFAGEAIVTTGTAGDAALWDATTGRRLRTLTGGGDGRNLSAESDARARRIIMIASDSRGAVVHGSNGVASRLPPPRSADHQLESARIDSAGTRAVLVDSNGNATLWDLDRRRIVAELRDHGLGQVQAAFSSDGLLATLDERGAIRVRDARTGSLLRLLARPPGRPGPIAFTPDGRLVATSRGGELDAWDAHAPVEQAELVGHANQTRRIDYLGDGATAVTGSRDGDLRVWDTASGRELRHIDGAHAGRVQWVAASSDGARIASTGDDGLARIWDARDGRLLHTLAGHDVPVLGAVWLAGGALATAGTDGTIRVWTAEGAQRCATAPLGHALLGAIASPDGRSILARAEGPVSGLWSADDCRLRHRLETGHESTLVAAMSRDGRTALLGGLLADDSKSGSGAYLVDVASGAMRPLPVADRMIVAGAFDPGGRRAVTSSIDSAIDYWDVGSGRRTGVVTGPPAAATSIAFDATGQLLFGGSADGILRTWDAATGELVGSRTGYQAGIYLLRVRPDGAQIATAGLEASPRLWRLSRWTGTAADLAALVRARVPWRIGPTGLEPVDLSASSSAAP